MAGAGRGRQQDGNLVKITLSNGLPVLCAILHGNTARLGKCVECGYFPEELYFLFCRHALCEQCFQARKQYSCKVDKTVTKKGDATHCSLNLPLQNIALKCPCCSDPLLYRKIKEHIETSHMEWLEQEYHLLKREVPKANLSTSVTGESAACTRGKCVSQQAAPQSSFTRQSEATPKQGEDKWQLHTTPVGYQGDASYSHRSQACGRETMENPDTELLTDDDSSDTTSLGERDKEYGIKGGKSEEIVSCPHCITACAASEIEEHKEKCPEREVNCHGCNEVITAKNYDKHMETHYRAGQTRCKEDEAQEAVNGAPESRWDAKKYIENILRQKKQLGDNPSVSVEDREKLIAELQTKQKEGNDRNKHRNELPAAIHSATAKTKKENPGTRGIKKEDEPPTRPMPEPEQQDVDEEMKKRREVIALKQRIKELEDRLEKLEIPLKALIKRLSEEQQQKGRIHKFN